jgi:cell division protein FtsL
MTRPEKVRKMVGSRNAKTGIRTNRTRPKEKGSRLTGRQIPLILGMLFLFMGSSIGYVWSNFEKTQLGYDLSQLKKEEMHQREVNRKLRLELAILKSPERLESVAVKELGLGQPRPEQIVPLP